MQRQAISLKKSLLQFLAAVMKLTSYHLLERTVNLSRQQEIRERKGSKGEENLYLTKRFI